MVNVHCAGKKVFRKALLSLDGILILLADVNTVGIKRLLTEPVRYRLKIEEAKMKIFGVHILTDKQLERLRKLSYQQGLMMLADALYRSYLRGIEVGKTMERGGLLAGFDIREEAEKIMQKEG